MIGRTGRAARLARILALGGVGLLLLAVVGYRLGLLSLGLSFGLLLPGLAIEAAALVIGVVTWGLGRADAGVRRDAMVAVGVAVMVLALPVGSLAANAGLPAIHHITTDPDDPPMFEAIVPLRGGSSNPLDYPGEELASVQRQAYPDVQPIVLAVAPSEAHALALEAAAELGWEVVAADAQAGVIEASDTTFVFGFVDDVVVRVRPDGAGSRLDLRSVSRVGVGDLGANARRIRAFARTVEASSTRR